MKYLNYYLLACLALVSASGFGMTVVKYSDKKVISLVGPYVFECVSSKNGFDYTQEPQNTMYIFNENPDKHIARVGCQHGGRSGIDLGSLLVTVSKDVADQVSKKYKKKIADLKQKNQNLLFGAFTAGCAFTALGFYAWQKWFRK